MLKKCKARYCFVIGLYFLCLICSINVSSRTAVTYLSKKEWGGRLGDMLIMYIKAKWVAYTCELPLLCKPFNYYDQLKLSELEQGWNSSYERSYKKKVLCKNISKPLHEYIDPAYNALYIVHYYFTLPDWGLSQSMYDSQEISEWSEIINDQCFLDQLKKTIAPRNMLIIRKPPSNMISVAVHIRLGGGFDHPLISRQLYGENDIFRDEVIPEGTFADRFWPLKFPPLQYYVDQIKFVSEYYNDQPIFLSLYTDTQDTCSLVKTIKEVVNKDNIIFDVRETNNSHNQNVLEDMFSMAEYDCLVRSGSNLPQVSQLIGNHQLVVYPKSCKWIGRTMIIDNVGFYKRSANINS